MAKPKKIELTADGVITQEALLAYAEGHLTDADRAQMDRLLQADPFAQDALEGMRQSSSPASIPTAITSLNTQLREKTGIRERKKKGIEIHWANYAYAAVVLGVLVGVGFVIIQVLANNRKDDIAMNKPAAIAAQESKPLVPEKKPEEKVDTIKQDTTKTPAQTEDVVDSTTIKGMKTLSYSATASNSAPVTLNAASSGSIDHEDRNGLFSTNADKHVPTGSKGPPVTAAITSENAAQLAVARAYFEASDFVNAERKYYEVLASQPDNADALYFGGICCFMNGTRDLGESNFNRLSKSNLYADGTKWYRANILIKKGKKEEAKPILRDLAASSSYFKERAVKQYEDLYGK